MNITLGLTVSFQLYAQEIERALFYNVEQNRQYLQRNDQAALELRNGSSLEIPFVDDFSRFSFPSNDPNTPASWQRWEESGAFFNESFPELPPTIGVVTLDGLAGDGYPYDFSNPSSYGPADTLTSLPIDLSSFDVNSNVYLSFYYQEGGLGNRPEEEDSLIVDFFSPDDDAWFRIWAVPGDSGDDDFQRAFLKVEESYFFRTEFKFRFRNYATLSGNLDHWNIDYVVLDENVDPDDFDLIDVAFVEPENTLLSRYTSMPWTHFNENPTSHMAQNIQTVQGNLNQDRNIVSGYRVDYEGSEQFDDPDLYLNTTGNGFSQFFSEFPINSDPSSYVYDTSVNDTCASFDVSIYTNTTPDENRWNDTLRFVQEFNNYYAYDDGTAERAYALENAAGGQVAVRFQSPVEDTLLGLFIHFTPFGEDVSNEIFLLRIWGENGGIPGNELSENFEFQQPVYYPGEPNIFGYYEYDNPVAVDGVFYVGFSQNSNMEYNLGLDKQGNSNSDNLFYKLGTGNPWLSSSIQGSVMIRPVFKSGKSEVWNSVEERESSSPKIYPNPSNGLFNIEWQNDMRPEQLELRDLSGRLIESISLQKEYFHQIDLSDIPTGMYLMSGFGTNGALLHSEKIIIK